MRLKCIRWFVLAVVVGVCDALAAGPAAGTPPTNRSGFGMRSKVFVVADFPGADPSGRSDSTDAFEAALAAAERSGEGAVIDLGGEANTWRVHPRFRSGYGFPVFLLPKVDGLTFRGHSAADRPTILMDAAPERGTDTPRRPSDSIAVRGEFCHVDGVSAWTWENFILRGQAPPTYNGNNWGDQIDGWDYSHKAFIWEHGSTANRLRHVDIYNFRGEFIYASGSPPRPGSILIEDAYMEGCNGSLFSCSAAMTARRCTIRKCHQGVENYAFVGQNTVIEDCDIGTAGWGLQTYQHRSQKLIAGKTYRIVDNAGGLDMRNVGAPSNDVGTIWEATDTDPGSFGTGAIEKYFEGAAIVFLNQKGTSVTIADTTLRESNKGILTTDFAHDVTLSNLHIVDCDYGIYPTSMRTSSSVGDYAAHAGFTGFDIDDLTVEANNRDVQAVFWLFGGGPHVPKDWDIDHVVLKQANGHQISRFFQAGYGVEPPFNVRHSDLRAVQQVYDVNTAETTYRAKFTDCILPEATVGIYSRLQRGWVPTQEGTIHFRDVSVPEVHINDVSADYLPDGFAMTIRSSDETFELTAQGGVHVAMKPGAEVSLTFDRASRTWRVVH